MCNTWPKNQGIDVLLMEPDDWLERLKEGKMLTETPSDFGWVLVGDYLI